MADAQRAEEVLIAAAQFERDQRLTRYPAKIAQLGPAPADLATIEQLCIDYQCWVAIAEWLETGRFSSFYGGANPDGDAAPLIRWPELEDAARQALNRIERKLAAEGWFDCCEPTATSERRWKLVHIHRMVQRRRESLEELNHQLRREAEERRRPKLETAA